MNSKNILLEKYIKVAIKKSLEEEKQRQQHAERSMYLVYRFPGLKKVMEDLMSPVFGKYINNISIISPKPTTFKIELINKQNFSIKYLGKGLFNVKVSGKKYNVVNLGELERASQSISDLLELNYAPSEGKEQSDKSDNPGKSGGSSGSSEEYNDDLSADLEAAADEPTPEPEENTEEI